MPLGPGTYVAAWLPSDHRDAVLLHLPHGALPAVLEALRARGTLQRHAGIMVGGALALGSLSAAQADAVLQLDCITRWQRGATPAVRLELGPECWEGGT